jgi:hypothetical protein
VAPHFHEEDRDEALQEGAGTGVRGAL